MENIAEQSKKEVFNEQIQSLRQSIPELQGVMITATDGLPIAFDFPSAEAARIAAMAATAIGIGKRVSESTELGEFKEMVIQSEKGYLVVYKSGDKGVLAVKAPSLANLGLIHLEARSTAETLAGFF